MENFTPNTNQDSNSNFSGEVKDFYKNDFKKFSEIFELTCQEFITPDLLNQTVEYDKSIEPVNLNYPMAKLINEQVWGQRFPAPFFVDNFDVLHQEVIAEKHTKCFLKNDKKFQAIFFNNKTLYNQISKIHNVTLLGRLDINTFKGRSKKQILIEDYILD